MYSTSLYFINCTLCSVVYCTPLYNILGLNLIFCTQYSVHLWCTLCTLCVVWLCTVTCTVFCTLCSPPREGGITSGQNWISHIGQLTEVWRLRPVLPPPNPLFHLWWPCVCAPHREGPLARGGWGDRIWRRTARSPLLFWVKWSRDQLRRHRRSGILGVATL